MYLMIQNAGVAAVEAFTLLGLSTARGDASSIGQFGSGAKHSILLLMRNNLTPIIYLGYDELEFYTKPGNMHGKDFNRLCYQFKGEKEQTGMVLEFGEMDWNDVGMALREFISNAIDQVGADKAVIQLVDSIVPYPDDTTVYIPANDQVKEYVANLSKNFLHFSHRENVSVISKPEPSPARLYRKGVFVREMPRNSMYDYNFGDDVKIDETRNMTDATCYEAAAKLLGNHPAELQRWVKSTTEERSPLWEDSFVSWNLGYKNVTAAYTAVFGDKVVCRNEEVLKNIKRSGRDGVIIRRNIELFRNSELPDGDELQGIAAKNGVMECKTTATMRRTFKKVWTKLENAGLTANKRMPELVAFQVPMNNANEELGGFQDGNKVYISMNHEARISTHIEEIGHYVTGAEDLTRTLQTWAFQAAAVLGFR